MNKKAIFIFFLIGCSIKFFDAAIANSGILKNFCFAFMFISILLSLPYFFRKQVGFVLPVQLICIAIVTSLFMGQYIWSQGLIYSSSTIPYAAWFVFFLLIKVKAPIDTIEKVVLIFGGLYVILFLFQFTHSGTVYFGQQEEFKEDRGIIRIIFPGGGVFFLSSFIAINKVTSSAKFKILWLLFALTALVIVVLQVTRQTIFIVLIIYLIHFLRNIKLSYKIAVITIFFSCSYLFLTSNTSIGRGLREQQKEDASYGKDYIRILTAEYYLSQFNKNTITNILGNGFPNDKSNYGKTLISLNQDYGYYLTDIGLIEVYITLGIIGIIGYFLLFIKSITIPLPENHFYLKYYLWMILATSLTSDFLMSYYFLITTVLVLYCYQLIFENLALLSTSTSLKSSIAST